MKLSHIKLSMLVLLTGATPYALAGTWGTQATLANNAYQGSIALDASGNMVTVWYQNGVNGSLVEEAWGSSAAFAQPWSAPVDISGGVGSTTGNPTVRMNTTGTATVVYSSSTLGAAYADKPLNGPWSSPRTSNGANQFFVSD